MRTASCFVLILAGFASAADSPVRIAGETKYKPHSLVRLKAEGIGAKAALI